mmetsp:Transcript_7081/g.11930  ORF Transcript_7081/g.11930 Transcript_7081/m.11930 type:complete len:166 (-) Transcript_7081:158-655(-)
MNNTASSNYRYNHWKVIGGILPGDYASFITLYAGADPANPDRVLVKKLVKISDNTWCLEHSTIEAGEKEGSQPTVHTQMFRLGAFDIEENITAKELHLRLLYRPMPNLLSFQLFSRASQSGRSGLFQVIENSFFKASEYRWSEWLKDFQDRRSIASYLKLRWRFN